MIRITVEIKQLDPHIGSPQIAHLLSNVFGIEMNKHVVKRVLTKRYIVYPNNDNEPS